MPSVSLFQDLFDHNDWANGRIYALCLDLADADLDAPYPIGFGTLRNTMFHLLEAEKLWLERWRGEPWRPIRTDAEGVSVLTLMEQAKTVAVERNALLADESLNHFERIVPFQDLQQNAWEFPIGSLLHHVANHGIYHRAQALAFLRRAKVKIPGGLDYIFWKIAYPGRSIPPESIEPMQQFGLEVAVESGNQPRFDSAMLHDYFTYADWAIHQVFGAMGQLTSESLGQEFEMGLGTLNKTVQHLIDAERWWLENWNRGRATFHSGEPKPLEETIRLYEETCQARNEFVESLDEQSGDRVVEISLGGLDNHFTVTESLVQLCGHGTHHRAQCVNMIRQLDGNPPATDYIVWLRQGKPSYKG